VLPACTSASGTPSRTTKTATAIRGTDASKAKRFRRGIEQLDAEGAVQVLRSDRRGDQAPVLAAVGPMQFEVTTHRLSAEFGVPTVIKHLPYHVARRTDLVGVRILAGAHAVETFTRDRDGALLAVFIDERRIKAIARDRPALTLLPLLADIG
jgi:peptide chain release factor 3